MGFNDCMSHIFDRPNVTYDMSFFDFTQNIINAVLIISKV